MAQTDSIQDAALAYAALRWYVIPLHTPRPGGLCSCRDPKCQNQGKHPRTRHGLSDASIDEDTIRAWWEMWPDANLGIVCGPSGLVVIDVDPRHGGDEDWRDLKAKYGKTIQQTVSAHTGGGGEHYVYSAPGEMPIANVSNSDKYTGPLGRGIDVRAAGGYIVAPPSLHVSGSYYEWYEGESPFDREPQRLPLEFAELLSQPARQSEKSAPISIADILAGVPEGGRDWELFKAASKLRYADIPIDWAYRLIEEAAANCTPPFPRNKARQKVESAYFRYEAGKTAIVEPDDLRHADGLAGRQLLGEAIATGPLPTPWLIEDTLVRGRIHMVYGEPESGKTILSIAWILHCVALGLNVLFIDEESGINAISGLLRDMGADPEDIDEHVHYFPFPSIAQPDFDALLSYADEIQPALIVFDSLTDMLAAAGLNENDGIEVTRWMDQVAQSLARRPYQPAVILVDHVPKDTENIRYSVASRAKKAKSDVLWYVRKTADFDRETTARVELERHKNRPGVLPKKLVYTVGGEGGMLICRPFDVSQDAISTRHELADEFLRILDENGPLGRKGMAALLGVGKDTVTRIYLSLSASGEVRSEGIAQQQRYYRLSQATASPVASDSPKLSQKAVARPPLYGASATASQQGETDHQWWQDKEEDDDW